MRTPVAATLVAAAVLGACGSVPPRPPWPAAEPAVPAALPDWPAPLPAPLSAPEARWQARLRQGLDAGCLPDAIVALEVLSLLRRDDAELGDRLASLRGLQAARAAALAQRGQEAVTRGAFDQGERLLLAALATQPDNADIAASLRRLEQERNRRHFHKPPPRRPASPGAEDTQVLACGGPLKACPAAC